MWLAWEIAAVVAVVCLLGLLVLLRRQEPLAVAARPFARELSTMFALYALWQLAGRISVIELEGAFRRARQIVDLQAALLLPSEAAIQEWLLPYGWLIQSANIYYATVHVPAMIGCLLWLFIRNRHYYSVTRNNLAMFTGAALLIQLVAVAPPRFLDEFGFVDTGVLYNQSVFSSLGYQVEGQLQAMPSIHAGWAFLVGFATWRMAAGWKRWLGPVHAVVTMLVIVVTANHFWMDGIVAALVLAGAMVLQHLVRSWLERRAETRASGGTASPPPDSRQTAELV